MGWREEEAYANKCYDLAEITWPKAADLLRRLRDRYVGKNNPMFNEINELIEPPYPPNVVPTGCPDDDEEEEDDEEDGDE